MKRHLLILIGICFTVGVYGQVPIKRLPVARITEPVAVDEIARNMVDTLTKAGIGLGNVDNTADVNKLISNSTQDALDLKAPKASPTFTGTVSGITKSMVGLGNVDNTSDAAKPVSTATQTALNTKVTAIQVHDSIAWMRTKINKLRSQMDSLLGILYAPPDNYIYVTDPGDNNDIAANLVSAYNSAPEGSVLILPEGIFKFTVEMDMYKLVSMVGAGKNKTILYRDNAVSDASTPDYFFVYSINRDSSSHFKFQGMTLRSKSPAALNNTGGSLKLDGALVLEGVVDFVISDCRFENFGYKAVTINHKADLARGVIYNNEFYHNFKGDHQGYGQGIGVYGDDASWVASPNFGTNNFIFIEDNTFDFHFQAVITNNAGLAVVRYNQFSNNWLDAAINVHESYGAPYFPGRALEVYNNIINATKFANGASAATDIVSGHSTSDLFVVAISPKGGDALVYNNQISGYQYALHAAAFPSSFSDVSYPVHYGLGWLSGVQYGSADRSIDHNNGDAFFWNNTLTTYAGYTPSLFDNWDPTWFIEGRDYHFAAKPGYLPYTYPHPLRAGN